MRKCIHSYVHTRTRTRTRARAHTHTHTRTHTHTCTHVYTCTHMHARVHVHTHAHTCTHMHTHAHTGDDGPARWSFQRHRVPMGQLCTVALAIEGVFVSSRGEKGEGTAGRDAANDANSSSFMTTTYDNNRHICVARSATNGRCSRSNQRVAVEKQQKVQGGLA